MARVFVTRRLVGDGLERLAKEHEVEIWPEADPPPPDLLLEAARRSDALLTTITDQISAAFMDAAPSMRIVSNLAVGYDNIDVDAASQRRVLVTNTPRVLTDAVADLAFALMLSFARRLPEGERAVREGTWPIWSPTYLLGHDLSRKTLGIIGLGAIGLATAKRALGFGMSVVYSSRNRKPEAEAELGVGWRSLADLLQESDYVSISVALNNETRHMVGASQLALMKREAVIINTARGGIIDQDALVEALRERRIGGAALDVFAVEPIPSSDPLLQLDNVVVTPHVGSATVETRTRMTDLAVDNIMAFFRGERPKCCVNGDAIFT